MTTARGRGWRLSWELRGDRGWSRWGAGPDGRAAGRKWRRFDQVRADIERESRWNPRQRLRGGDSRFTIHDWLALAVNRLCVECSAVIAVRQGSRCTDCAAALEARQTARNNAEFGGSGGRWQSLRRQVLARQEGRCARCGNELGTSFEVDHVRPRAQFRGPNTEALGHPSRLENLQAMCRPCHRAKSNADRKARTLP